MRIARIQIAYSLVAFVLYSRWAPADQQTTDALANCRAIILADQLDDGALRMNSTTDAVNIVPYFSNLAAMALLATLQPGDVPRVRKWVKWYGEHQENDGTIYDHRGMIGNVARSKDRDSTDSYAATYLMVLWRYSQAAGDPRVAKQFGPAARKAVDAIALTQDAKDGLTWAKPKYRAKYLMDNLEVCSGLDEGSRFFDAIGDAEQAGRCRSMRQACEAGLQAFWIEPSHCYAWAKVEDGSFTVGLKDWYPDGMANLFAVSLIDPPRPVLWQNLQKTFGHNPTENSDWWLRAAMRAGTQQEVERYRKQALKEAAAMNAHTSLDRAAWMTLSLCWEHAGLK